MNTEFKVGQTWRTRDGSIRTIEKITKDIILIPGGLKLMPDGFYWPNQEPSPFDLIEQVTRVYIAGPMTGLPQLNFPAFNAAAALYRARGCFVINPAEMNGGDAELAAVAAMTPEQYAEHYCEVMRKDIAAVTKCDMIVMLPGWTVSKGATAELAVAQICGLAIVWPA